MSCTLQSSVCMLQSSVCVVMLHWQWRLVLIKFTFKFLLIEDSKESMASEYIRELCVPVSSLEKLFHHLTRTVLQISETACFAYTHRFLLYDVISLLFVFAYLL